MDQDAVAQMQGLKPVGVHGSSGTWPEYRPVAPNEGRLHFSDSATFRSSCTFGDAGAVMKVVIWLQLSSADLFH